MTQILPTTGTVSIAGATPVVQPAGIPITGNSGLQLGTGGVGTPVGGPLPTGTPSVTVGPAATGGTASKPTVTTTTGGAGGAGTSGSGTGLAGTTLNAPEYIAGIEQEYGSQISAAPTTQELYTQGEGSSIGTDANGLGVTGSAADQSATVNAQADAQDNTLKTGINQTENQQQLSLAELAAQIRGQHAGLDAQLGAVGAGSSSAEGQGETALEQEQNTNAANIDQQGTAAITNANSQIQGVGEVQQANLKSIQDWKNTQITQIQNNYAIMMQNLNTAVSTAQGEEKARLAEFGQTLTNAALQSLTAINNTNSTAVSTALNQGTTAQATQQTAPVATNLPTITTSPISPFQPSTTGNATASNETVPSGGGLSSLIKQQ